MALLKPRTWPRRVKLAIPSAAAAGAFALQSIAGFDIIELNAWEFSSITAGGVVGAFFAVWLPLTWQRSEAEQVGNLQQEVATLKQEREVYARELMYQYLNPLFKVVEYTQRLTGLTLERRVGFEQAIKERAVRAAYNCARDVQGLRVTFFHFGDGPNRLTVASHSDSSRGILGDLVAGSKHADYILDAISNNVGGLEPNLRSSKSAVRWPAGRNFQTLAFFPVRTPRKAYGVLMFDAPTAGALQKRHLDLLVLVAHNTAGSLRLCDRTSVGATQSSGT